MKNLLIVLTFMAAITVAGQAQTPVYKNPNLPVEQRIQDLLKRMTLEEKAGQLNQVNGGFFTGPAANDPGQKTKLDLVRKGKMGSFLNVTGAAETRAVQKIAVEESRLGIPLLFALDVIHGYRTVFPIPLAEACSWEPALAMKSAAIAAKEAAAAGVHWTFAPNCDVSHDPRWGRVMEASGEDPYLSGLFGAARVKGFQGAQWDDQHILACIKHYGVYGAVESGREYNQVDVSRYMAHNLYLPPYKAAVDAGAATIMNSFNVFEGIPASGNYYLNTEILKKKWGFKGLLVSDWASFSEMIAHGYAADRKDAALKAILSGSHMDMESYLSMEHLPALVNEKKVPLTLLDEAVSKVLWWKFKLGLFENPYKYCDENREQITMLSAEHRAAARESARKSIVLLKNERQVLPLAKSARRVAVIGRYANSKEDLFDFWIAKGNAAEAVTLLEGLRQAVGQNVDLSYSSGYRHDNSTDDELIMEAIRSTRGADQIILSLGISGKQAGEDRSLADINLPAGQLRLVQELQKTGKPLIAVIHSGRPLVLTALEPLVDAMVQVWIGGTEGGHAIADVLFGDYNPSAKTVISFPYAVGQIPVYYNHFNTGRPVAPGEVGAWKSRYLDIPNQPLYPFGYGLSYSRFKYDQIKTDKTQYQRHESITVSATIENTGALAGEEIVQLYIWDVTANQVRPVKELKGFKKILLKPGEKQIVNFTLTQKDLSYFNSEGNLIFEPGKFILYVGSNSRDVMQTSVEVL